MTARTRMGRVYLVGAGPGDPRLLTLRAARLLKRADVVLHDGLVGDAILQRVPASAECIDVSKRSGGRGLDQERINDLLIDAARRARTVVRLKGGDPFVFGRGGEEVLALTAANVPCEVVPGITAALGAAAYACVPLTQRGVSNALTLITGQCCAGGYVDWHTHASADSTLVLYMAVRTLHACAARLIDAGRSADTPAMVVEAATTPRQRTVIGTLGTIAERAAHAGIASPALAIIGEVVAHRGRDRSFDRRPLHGRRILVARSRPQRSRVAARLTALGADVLEAPRLEARHTAAPVLDALLARAADAAGPGDTFIMITDTASVHALRARLAAHHLDVRGLARWRFIAFGRAVAAALQRMGLCADVMATSFAAHTVPALFRSPVLASCRDVFFLRGEGGASPLAEAVRSLGTAVHEVVVYRAEPCADAVAAVRRRLHEGWAEYVVFASSASVHRFAALFGPPPDGVRCAAIGPATAHALTTWGLAADIIPDHADVSTLVAAIHGAVRC